MKIRAILLLSAFFVIPFSAAAIKPKLVVNIVVSQMRYDYMTRFERNFGAGGFRQFLDNGLVFADARYNFMQTITPATLATITTGADPSMHGVVSTRWIDYTNNNIMTLIACPDSRGVGCDYGIGAYSPRNLTAPTIGDRLRQEDPGSKVITIAIDPVSAVVMGGLDGQAYWMDNTRGTWISSTAYMNALPGWAERYNDLRIASQYIEYSWMPVKARHLYANSSNSIFDAQGSARQQRTATYDFLLRAGIYGDYEKVFHTPAGNSLVGEFARQAIINEALGKDEHTDILNLCFDSPRYAGQLFGSESMEVEDMFYRMDTELAEFLTFLYGQVDPQEVVVVLTSDHGASDSYDHNGQERERFNANQFRVIVNGFMNAQYGPGDWVIDYCDRQLYLNRDLIYRSGLNITDVQNRVAAFVLQFRGVSHVLSATALQMSSFSGIYAEKMQNSFYPKRSGDLTINLMPGWIEEREGLRSDSGSMYEYDTHVPLMILANRFYGQKVLRPVDMRDLAPSLARIMQISRPIAAEGEAIEEVAKVY